MKTLQLTVVLEVEDGTSPIDVQQWLLAHLKSLGLCKPQVWWGKATEHADVRAFHRQFTIPQAIEPSFLNHEAYEFRTKFLEEELTEFRSAHVSRDLLGAADALVDLVYVAHGTAAMMGLPWFLIWQEVQKANMAKVRATRAEDSKRGTALDVVKPAGWKAPDHSTFLGEGPWPTFQGDVKA